MDEKSFPCEKKKIQSKKSLNTEAFCLESLQDLQKKGNLLEQKMMSFKLLFWNLTK